MCTTPVLAMLDFSKPFTIESDACDNKLGAALLQEEHHIAFTSKSLSGKNLAASTYEKEMMVILHVVQKWCPYVLGIISTSILITNESHPQHSIMG